MEQGFKKINKSYSKCTRNPRASLEKHELVTAAVASFGEYIKNEVLADDLSLVESVAGGEAIELPEEVTLGMLVELS